MIVARLPSILAGWTSRTFGFGRPDANVRAQACSAAEPCMIAPGLCSSHCWICGPRSLVVIVTASAGGEFWSVLAAETHRPFTVSAPGGALWVPVSADHLGAALDALLDNVFSHTPSGTRFALAVTPGVDGTVDVVVEDAGPGLLEPLRPGVNGCGSTGIGLDLARRTAEQAGGQVTVRRGDAGGARVVMSLPFREP